VWSTFNTPHETEATSSPLIASISHERTGRTLRRSHCIGGWQPCGRGLVLSGLSAENLATLRPELADRYAVPFELGAEKVADKLISDPSPAGAR
jgi:hypothetical protein